MYVWIWMMRLFGALLLINQSIHIINSIAFSMIWCWYMYMIYEYVNINVVFFYKKALHIRKRALHISKRALYVGRVYMYMWKYEWCGCFMTYHWFINQYTLLIRSHFSWFSVDIAKEPYISAKEPYTSAKDPNTHHKFDRIFHDLVLIYVNLYKCMSRFEWSVFFKIYHW